MTGLQDACAGHTDGFLPYGDAMKIADILKGKKSVTIIEPTAEHDGFVVSYSRDSVTLNNLKAIQESNELEVVAEGLMMNEVEWNLKDNDGNPVPTDLKGFMGVPIDILNMVTTAIQENEAPKEAK